MIKALIIEDEEPAYLRLKKLINQVSNEIEIIDWLDSVEASVKWFKQNQAPQLIFLDIQLADGLSFEIFKQVTVDSFVIFTTAYDEYAIKAFELNSIDYLLKPVETNKLEQSLQKYKRLSNDTNMANIANILQAIEGRKANYKKRFLINMGAKIKTVETDEIACLYVLEKNTFIKTMAGKTYPIDFSLDKIETLIDPEMFYRINRQVIINFKAIERISVYSKSRIKIETNPPADLDLMVSANKSHEFRTWLDR